MRMRNPKDKDEVINNCDFFYDKEIGFSNTNPIHIEIGMGKGKFIQQMALKYPNINFIGVEKYSSVASIAIKKINQNKPDNLRILIMDAINLPDILEKKVSCIYLNFSDPWPKDRHEKRRLTSKNYLEVYDKLFKGINVIIQKTDNDKLFEYSKNSLEEYGYKIEEISYDLAASEIDNITTEYEEKFSSEGIKIKYLKAIKK